MKNNFQKITMGMFKEKWMNICKQKEFIHIKKLNHYDSSTAITFWWHNPNSWL